MVCHIHNLDNRDVSGALRVLDSVFPEVAYKANTTKIRQAHPQRSTQSHLSAPVQVVDATGLKRKHDSIEILAVTEIYSFPLKEYITTERGIPFGIAKEYLHEVKCRTKGYKEFYALGFASGDTYALRNKHFKGFAGTGVDIRIFDQATPHIILFEGCIDFLSYLAAKKLTKPDKTAIVLNGYAMIRRATDFIQRQRGITEVEFFRDRDEVLGKQMDKNTGLQTLTKLQTELGSIPVIDRSEIYKKFKDLNDWRINLLRSKAK